MSGLPLKIGVALVANVIALWAADRLFGGVATESFGWLLGAGAVLGVLNAIVKPVLIVLSIPVLLLTLGLFLLIINITVLWITDALLNGFDIEGFWTYVGVVVVLWLVNAVIDRVLDKTGVIDD
jgi:putative membrane protein